VDGVPVLNAGICCLSTAILITLEDQYILLVSMVELNFSMEKACLKIILFIKIM
jgi:hypothetical protein